MNVIEYIKSSLMPFFGAASVTECLLVIIAIILALGVMLKCMK